MDEFDPYYSWLGIPPKDQPPNHYRLLGLEMFESNPTVISNMADQRMTALRNFSLGQHGALSQKLLNEVAAAKICLLSEKTKTEYDSKYFTPSDSAQNSVKSLSGPLLGQTAPIGVAIRQPPIARYRPTSFRRQSKAKNPVLESAKIIGGGIVGIVLAMIIVNYIQNNRDSEPKTKRQPKHTQQLVQQPVPIPPRIATDYTINAEESPSEIEIDDFDEELLHDVLANEETLNQTQPATTGQTPTTQEQQTQPAQEQQTQPQEQVAGPKDAVVLSFEKDHNLHKVTLNYSQLETAKLEITEVSGAEIRFENNQKHLTPNGQPVTVFLQDSPGATFELKWINNADGDFIRLSPIYKEQGRSDFPLSTTSTSVQKTRLLTSLMDMKQQLSNAEKALPKLQSDYDKTSAVVVDSKTKLAQKRNSLNIITKQIKTATAKIRDLPNDIAIEDQQFQRMSELYKIAAKYHNKITMRYKLY